MTAPRDRARRPNIRKALWDALDAAAESMDVETGALVNAVLDGANRTGQLERLARVSLANERIRRRRREHLREWVSDRDTPLPGAADQRSTIWRSGPYRMTRYGQGTAGFWLLEGPGVTHGIRLPAARRDAGREADAILQWLDPNSTTGVPGDVGP